jgi:hypothetical protein
LISDCGGSYLQQAAGPTRRERPVSYLDWRTTARPASGPCGIFSRIFRNREVSHAHRDAPAQHNQAVREQPAHQRQRRGRRRRLHPRVEPRSNNAIAAGLSSFETTHHQKLDVVRHPQKAQPTTRKLRAKDRSLANDFVSDEEFHRLLRAWFGNIVRVLLPGRSFYIWGGYANCGNYPPVLREVGLYFSQAVIWHKQHPVLTRKDYMGDHEWSFYGWKEGA